VAIVRRDRLQHAKADGEKPVSRVAAVIVVAAWLICVALAVSLALRIF
jgi:hypothetical protein